MRIKQRNHVHATAHRSSGHCVTDELHRLRNRVTDLEFSLVTATEHGDLLQDHLYRMSKAMAAEVQERQAAEQKLRRLLEALTQEKADLEIMLQILIEQGDFSAAEGEQSRIDGLTGIANRRRLDEHLQQEWERHQAGQKPLGFLLCDVDHFKDYNDHNGHQAGDDCLRTIGALIRSVAPESALTARYGGEEFAVVLPHFELEGAVAVAEQIRLRVLAAAIEHTHTTPSSYVTVSIGVASMPPALSVSTDPSPLIREADRLLYVAKSRGRNRVESAHVSHT